MNLNPFLTRLTGAIPLRGWYAFFILSGGIFGLGGFTFNYASGFSYLSDDPRACANCHVMRDQYDGWNRAPHHAVAVCNDCHTPHDSLVAKYTVKAINGFKHSKAFTLNDIPDTIRITPFNRQVAEENCIACHGEMVSFIEHRDSQNPTDCLACHSGVGHGQ